MKFRRPKRQVPTPAVVKPHQSANPMFVQDELWSSWRVTVLLYTGLVALLIASGWLMYGRLFQIQTVTVSGTRVIDPASIKRLTERYLQGFHWLVLPNRTLWTLSATDLTRTLERQIRQRISVDQVVIIKQPPRSLQIVVVERTPVVTWSSANQLATVDRQGKIIELRNAPLKHTPLVVDENAYLLTVDGSVVKPEVMAAIEQLALLLQQANIQNDHFIIPVPTCPSQVPMNTSNSNANLNINQSRHSLTENTNIQPIYWNSNLEQPPAAVSCDRPALRFGSQEIHLQLTNGPRVLFDRQSNLSQSVQALQRVLSERSHKTYKTIDVRFGDRVYVQ